MINLSFWRTSLLLMLASTAHTYGWRTTTGPGAQFLDPWDACENGVNYLSEIRNEVVQLSYIHNNWGAQFSC